MIEPKGTSHGHGIFLVNLCTFMRLVQGCTSCFEDTRSLLPRRNLLSAKSVPGNLPSHDSSTTKKPHFFQVRPLLIHSRILYQPQTVAGHDRSSGSNDCSSRRESLYTWGEFSPTPPSALERSSGTEGKNMISQLA